MQLEPTDFVTHVNNVSTPNLSEFLTEIKKIKDNEYFSMSLVNFFNVPWVATMKKNEHYFPTIEYIKDASQPLGWKRIVHKCGTGGVREEMSPDELEADTGDE